ncbi:MAG: VWA domain-containing protein [Myxococcota bacterium]|nr:VWA domain-containing protein [Myxococcota bacterium]
MENLQKEIEGVFYRFVEFERRLDKQSRLAIVEFFREYLGLESDKYTSTVVIDDNYYQYIKGSLLRILELPLLAPLTKKSEKLRYQIASDLLKWMRDTHKKIRLKPQFQDEIDELKFWSEQTTKQLVSRSSALFQYLKGHYEPHEFNYEFYEDKIIEAKKETSYASDEIELVYCDLFSSWDGLLSAKYFKFYLSEWEQEEEEFTDLVESKASELSRLMDILSPVSNYLGWNLEKSLWHDTSFDVLKSYSEFLEDEKCLKDLVDKLGKLRESEIELEEEVLSSTISNQSWINDPLFRGEISGVTNSDNLSALLSGEAGTLGNKQTEDLFLFKFAQKNLQTFKYEDRRLMRSDEEHIEVYKREKEKEKGPFIICVDTSGSMEGEPERIAKVLCMGILKEAMIDNRKVFLVNFSAGVKFIDLQNISESMDELVKFLKMSFYGGTDITHALAKSIETIQEKDYQKADVLVISDFIMYQVKDWVISKVKQLQEDNQTQFHSLILSKNPTEKIVDCFDNSWLYNPYTKGIMRDLARDVIPDIT